MKIKSKANAALGLHANPVEDAGGHDGTGRDSDDGGVCVAFVKEPEERGPNQEPGHLVT
jgi:hypothetical protein